ncbi:MAG: hypothetical protein ACQEQU_04250 [Spirochaetota bacterium]
MRGNISIWVYLYTLLHALFMVFMGAAAYIDPSFQFTGLLLTSSVLHPIGFYANRNIAVAVAAVLAVVYGLRTRRPYQISTILVIFLVTDIADLVLLLLRNDATPLMIGVYAVLFWIPEILSLIYLFRKFKPYRKRANMSVTEGS